MWGISALRDTWRKDTIAHQSFEPRTSVQPNKAVIGMRALTSMGSWVKDLTTEVSG